MTVSYIVSVPEDVEPAGTPAINVKTCRVVASAGLDVSTTKSYDIGCKVANEGKDDVEKVGVRAHTAGL